MNEAEEEMAALEEEREAELHGTDIGTDYGEITGRSGGLITGRTSARSGMPSKRSP